MVLSRIFLVAALIAVLMFGIKDGRLLKGTGLLGSCEVVSTPRGAVGTWWACSTGKLDGRHRLTEPGCESMGTVEGREYWRCLGPS